MTRSPRTSFTILLAICGGFFLYGACALEDYGVTADEAESSLASQEAWEFATGSREDFSHFHTIPGYYFALDLSRAAFVRAVRRAFPNANGVLAEHAFNLGIATACLALLFFLALEIGGSPRAAAISTVCLALAPIFIGHSQNNPKDLPAVFGFLLAFWLLVRAVRRGGARPAIVASLALGLSLNLRTFSAVLLPMFVLWLVCRWPEQARAQWRRLAWIGLGAGLTAFALWPWAWTDPIGRFGAARGLLGEILSVRFEILYLGRIWLWTEVPWHYTPFHLLATTPLALLLLSALSLVGWWFWKQRDPKLADLVWTGAVWVVSLLAVEQLATARYDGIRHYLMILVGMSLLAGAGAEWLLRLVPRTAAWCVLGLLGLVVAWEGARLHPYESAYLNPIAVLLAGPRTEQWLEVGYWGSALKEGSEWLQINVEPDAVIHAPVFGDIARRYLAGRMSVSYSADEFLDASRPRYLMLVTRWALYDPATRSIEASREPIFAIRRQRSTLLEIYRNDAPDS